MSLRSIQQGINEAINGKDCKLCQEYGVTCHDVGLIDNGNAGETRIFVDGNFALRTKEKIAQCDAITGNVTHEEVANKIKENYKKSKGTFDFSNLKIGNY